MKKSTLTLAGLISAVVLLAGCSQGAPPNDAGEDTQPAQAENEEESVAESHADLTPEDYTSRLPEPSDLPGNPSIDEEYFFGDPLSGESSVFSEDEPDPNMTDCASNIPSEFEDALDMKTAGRIFTGSGTEDFHRIAVTLTKPDRDPKELVDSVRTSLQKCSELEPQKALGEPIDSISTFEPSGNKGEGVCATSFTGNNDSVTIVYAGCYLAWADEFSIILNVAAKSKPSTSVDEEAIEQIKKQLVDDIMPATLSKSGFAAS